MCISTEDTSFKKIECLTLHLFLFFSDVQKATTTIQKSSEILSEEGQDIITKHVEEVHETMQATSSSVKKFRKIRWNLDELINGEKKKVPHQNKSKAKTQYYPQRNYNNYRYKKM